MDGLEASEISLYTAIYSEKTFRMDAEFYQKTFLSVQSALKNSGIRSLSSITVKIDVGYVGSMTSEYSNIGIPLLQTKNVAAFFVKKNSLVLIKPAFHEKLSKSKVIKNDILVARSGSFGTASIYLEDLECNSADIIIIQSDLSQVNPFYLVAFLNR